MYEALSLVSVPLSLGLMGLVIHLVETLAAHVKSYSQGEVYEKRQEWSVSE